MTTCPHCGADNPSGNAFCEKCGKPVAAPTVGPTLRTMSDLQTIGGDPTQRRVWSNDATMAPGTVFAERYTIESLLGSGGMGVVYRAKDRIGNREVALKLIRPDRLDGAGAVDRLIAEGVLTQDIRHKNVVAVYHVDQLAGQPFMAMEFVNGVSLREWHRKLLNARKDIAMAVAARIIAEVLNGLEVAHAMGIVHRDLKPENIMLTSEPTAEAVSLKLLDFGIARVVGGGTTDSGSTGLGTPRYMAPEQITNPDSATPAADFYSLSTIFYELLVDVLPTGGWQPPSSGRPDVPQGIDALIQSGLQNRPASRPQSVADYRQRLNAAFGGGVQRQQQVNNLVGGDSVPRAPAAGVPMWAKISGGVLGGLLLLGGIGAAIDGAKQEPQANTMHRNDDGGIVVENSVTGIVGKDDDAPILDYSRLNGPWIDPAGAEFNVRFDANGSFGGDGIAGGVPTKIEGRFSGAEASFTLSDGQSGRLYWANEGHVNYDRNTPAGLRQGCFHINHQPTTPCPAQSLRITGN
ncbi:serine/threonine-protein kinase [Sphingomonas sp.]|uniref:serine/threonine-protein kinase n=1 Tax=Sphingomonas sp. TaxID=28214 RepID=UPI003B005FEC